MGKITAASLAGGHANNERIENDYYATAPESTYGLFNVEDFEDGSTFLEPCCGEGHISKIICNKFPNSEVESTDLIDRGYGKGDIDFLTANYDRKFDYVVTNPPYSLAQEFVEKSLSITNKKVAMFLKVQFLEGMARHSFFQKTPLKKVFVFSGRQAPWSGGLEKDPKTGKKWSSTMCFAWFIWEVGYVGDPIIKWIHPSQCSGERLDFSKTEYVIDKVEENDDFWS